MKDANCQKTKVVNCTGKGHEEYYIAFFRHTTLVRVCVALYYVLTFRKHYMPVPLAARSKAWVCCGSLAEISSLNPAGAWMFASSENCVLSKVLCVGLITRPEESYHLCCLTVIVKPQ